MAEDLFAYQLNHPLPQEQQPIFSVRPPSSSRKGKRSKKRRGAYQNSNSENINSDATGYNNDEFENVNSNTSKNNDFDQDTLDNKKGTKKARANNPRSTKNKIRTNNSDDDNIVRNDNNVEQQIDNNDAIVNNSENINSDENNSDENDSKDELQRYKEIALSGGDFSDIPTELLSPLMRQLFNERASCLSKGLVNEAEVADDAIHKCRELMTDQAKLDAMNSRQQEINERLVLAQNDLASLQETIERQERNLRIQLQKQVISLEAKHQDEIDTITREWESPERARRYNRSSAQLRQLRAQALKLLNAHRYDEMKVVERMAEKLQADEIAASQQKWENDFNAVLRKLLGKHQMEKEKLQMAQNVQIGEYEAAKKFDLSVIQKRIQNLERELVEAGDSERVWNLYHRNDIVVTTKISSGAGKQKVKPSEFSTLNLPPLADSKTSRMTPAQTLAVRTLKYSPRTPRLTQ